MLTATPTKLEGVVVKVNEAYHTLVHYCGDVEEDDF
jgi:hypothetical protein